MKNLLLPISLLVLLISTSCTQKKAYSSDTDEEDVEVVEVVEAVESINNWKLDTYVDDFGDPTDEKYLYTTAEGQFSNSATTNSHLNVRLITDTDNTRFVFYEYGSHQVKGNDSYWFSFKLPNDSIVRLLMFSNRDGYITTSLGSDKEEQTLRDIMSTEGLVSVAVEEGGYGSSTYRFKMDFSGYKDAMKRLNK